MELKDFDYDLPEELIAQYPLEERSSSRLLVLERSTGAVKHAAFPDIKRYLKALDVLVLNDTKVMPARLIGKKETGGRIELLVTEDQGGEGRHIWRCMARPSKGLYAGIRVFFEKGAEAKAVGTEGDGFWTFEFSAPEDFLDSLGRIPLPPYIRRAADETDKIRYQTVFAEKKGAVAAPTAGLHFTKELLEGIKRSGVEVNFITLHTGPGTFMPVRSNDIKGHKLMPEYYSIPASVFSAVRKAKEEKRRIVAVGTTVTRALEASVSSGGFKEPVLTGKTGLFICPGYEFKAVDVLLTNFHLPCSTLIMLASAFAGHEALMRAYKEAVKERYRFFSYGDAMLII